MELTKKDIDSVIALISTQCPEAFAFKNADSIRMISDLWYNCFKDYPVEVVFQAVANALKNNEYQKCNWLAAVNKEIEKIVRSTEKNEIELWSELTSTFYAVRELANSLNCTFKDNDGLTQADKAEDSLNKIYRSLDPLIKGYVRRVSELIRLARADTTDLSVEKGRFLKAIPLIREKEVTLNQMPQEVKLYFSKLNRQQGFFIEVDTDGVEPM